MLIALRPSRSRPAVGCAISLVRYRSSRSTGSARERDLPVATVSQHFTPPWTGKFAVDSFHPSQDGYRDWTRALLTALPAPPP